MENQEKYIQIITQTLTKQFELLFITKQVLIDNFFTTFLFKSAYKRNTRLSYSKVHVDETLSQNNRNK